MCNTKSLMFHGYTAKQASAFHCTIGRHTAAPKLHVLLGIRATSNVRLANAMNNYNKTFSTAASPTVSLIGTKVTSSVGLSWSTILWAFTNAVLFVCILGGNVLTIVAVRTCRRLRCLISNLFILSLAVSDFIVGLTLPYHLAFYLGFNLGNKHGLCLARFFLIIFACCVSILTLITISVDRYIAIVYALHYRRYMTRRVAVITITFNWTIGATVAGIPMFWNHWNTAYQCEFDEVLPPWYMAGIITPSFALIWILMLLMYWRIMKEASKQANQLRNPRRKRASNLLHPDWRSVQVVVFIMGCFSLCWLPYFIVACAQIFEIYKTTPLLYKAAFSLAMTNSALNPIIYSWKNSNFRRAFVQLIQCRSPNCHQKSSLDDRKRSSICQKRHSISSVIIPMTKDEGGVGKLPCREEQPPKIYTVSTSTASDTLSAC